ncbi:MAG: PrgI family protein [Patescibacteria group bacterium]
MKFQLPQFIETEVKLVGPFTLKQFLWIAAGASMLFVLFIVVHGFWFFVLAIPIVASSLSLAFVKMQGVPLINYASYMLSYFLNPKKYLYQNRTSQSLPINLKNNG